MDIKSMYEQLIPKNLQVYFTEDKNGLSMSAAGHITNVIKNNMMEIDLGFNNLKPYTKIMDFEGKDVVLEDGSHNLDIVKLSMLEGESYALSAWLKVAIKSKETMFSFIKNAPFTELTIEELDGKFMEEVVRMPKQDYVRVATQVTEENVIGNLNIAEMSTYLKLEAEAAHLGKKIHPDGKVYELRKSILNNELNAFRELPNGNNGKKSYLITYKPVYTIPEVNKLFLELQDKHRSINAQLNHIKAGIKNEVTKLNSELAAKYSDDVELANVKYKKEYVDYNDKLNVINQNNNKIINTISKRRLELVAYCAKLKIVIPKNLEIILNDYQKN